MMYYGMVTTTGSAQYTPLALTSFFANTTLGPEDKFFLIDNNRDFTLARPLQGFPIEVIKNSAPKSFAANVNQIMQRAKEKGADLFFLNNDLVFTPGWLTPFSSALPAILSPISNREVQYELPRFTFKNVISLEEFKAHQSLFGELLRIHRSRGLGGQEVIMLPFFCVKIPAAVYSIVGPLDEQFGVGGAEDNDYCLRAILAGFKIKYEMQSFVLHFNGRSTWGVESKEATEHRCKTFTEKFRGKWGARLTAFCIDNDLEALEREEIKPLVAKGDFAGIVRAIAKLDGVDL